MACLSACIQKQLNKAGLLNENAEIQEISFSGKRVLFLGISHLATSSFYKNVKYKVDSLKRDGYFLFLEGVKLNTNDIANLSDDDIIGLKKIRKIVGFSLHNYSSNPVLERIKRQYSLTGQTKEIYGNIDSTNSLTVDFYNADLIRMFEEKRGEIVLDQCDLSTPLNQEYKCQASASTESRFFRDSIILKRRNELLASQLFRTENKKILIIFGREHFAGLVKEVENIRRNLDMKEITAIKQ